MKLLSLNTVRKALTERSLIEFIRLHWLQIDPSDYVHGWHIDLICEHLEAESNRPPPVWAADSGRQVVVPQNLFRGAGGSETNDPGDSVGRWARWKDCNGGIGRYA